MHKVIALLLLFLVSHTCFSEDVIRYIDSKKYPDPKSQYFVDLLSLALDSTVSDFGPYKLAPVSVEMAQARSSAMLARNEYIDLTWRMTSHALEQQLAAIYVPLLKGMMGYRIFIIRAGEQPRFTQDMSLSALQQLPVGQGYNWPDSDILRSNHFNVVEGYDIYLLKMLSSKRFDYFPRAIHEPWHEISGNNAFEVEQHLLLKYYSPIYFFVNRHNSRLKQRLTQGMTNIVNSGAMENLFYQHPVTAGIIEKAKLEQRKVCELANPLMSKQTKALIADERLWLEIMPKRK